MAEEVNMGDRITPSLLARDLAETRDFYVKRLKFQVTGCYPNKEAPHWLEFSRDGVKLYFFDEPPLAIPDTPGLSGTLYFYPKSVAALAEELREEVPFERGPEVMDYGMYEFGIRDPNGYYLAFTEPA